MASIRKREWTSGGERKEAWITDYFDQAGKRHIKTFPKKKDADAWLTGAKGEVSKGTHTPDSTSKTVGEAGDLWIAACEAGDEDADPLERGTTKGYREHLRLHINPLIGSVKLSQLTAPMVKDFRRRLRQQDRSPAMVRKITTTLGSIVRYALENGLTAKNVVQGVGSNRGKKQKKRQNKKIVPPSKADIHALIAKADRRFRPLLVTAAFTGLRASELRGLTWDYVGLDNNNVITVEQRADAWNVMGPPKSEAGSRTVPLWPMVVNALREWKLACPKGSLNLVFPNGCGNIESQSNIDSRMFNPLQIECGITKDKFDEKGNPILDKDGKAIQVARHRFHDLRHFAASMFIETKWSPKKVMTVMGHSTIQLTYDRYGHLFPSEETDQADLATMEKEFLKLA